MKKILTNIIIWVLKRNPEIKDNVINNFKGNQNIDVELKNDNIVIDEHMLKFNNVKAGDIIISKTKDWHGKFDLKHFYRPYFIVGRTNEELYGLYCTSSDKVKNDKRFYHYYNNMEKKEEAKVSHVDCRCFFVLNSCHFKGIACTLDIKSRRKIIEKVINNSNANEDIIDFNSFKIEPKINSVVKYNGEFYFIYDKFDNDKFCSVRLKENTKTDKGLMIFNKGYGLDKTGKEVIDKDNIDYVIYEQTNEFSKSVHKLKTNVISKEVKNDRIEIEENDEKNNEDKYKFGDVLSLRNSKNKIIYLTSFNKQIYYITDEQLELYTGMRFVHESEINGFYRKLSDKEFSRLINVLNKPLNSEKIKFVPDDVKNDIKNNISRKQLK